MARMRRPGVQLLVVILLVGALATLQAIRPFLTGGGDGDEGFPLPQAEPCLEAIQGVEAPTSQAPGVRGIAELVEALRERRFDEIPKPQILASAAFERRVSDSVDYPEEEADRDTRALTALGATPPGTDLKGEVTDLLEGQVAGFYDTETKELVIRAGQTEDGLDATERVTLAHELEHALADQAVGLPDLEDPPPGEEDAATAALALVEGDAQLVTELYVGVGLTFEEQVSLATGAIGGTGLEEAPYYLSRSLLFPYVEGARFVCDLHTRGGWDAVDAALADPPTTTAQVLFPERFTDGEGPLPVPEAPELPAAWEAAEPLAFGAADLLFLFEAPGGDPDRALDDPLERARQWAGGAMHLWTRGQDTATSVLLRDRRPRTGPDLCGSMLQWYVASFPEADAGEGMEGEALIADGQRQDAVLLCPGTDVRLGIGPDLATARRAAG